MKLVKSSFNDYTGVSTVALKNHGKTYTGTSILHPEDWENASKYVGCRLAEKRAMIEYYKEKKNIARIKRDAIISLIKDIENDNHDDGFASMSKYNKEKIKHHLNYWNREYKINKNNMNTLYKSIQEDIVLREKLLKRTEEKN